MKIEISKIITASIKTGRGKNISVSGCKTGMFSISFNKNQTDHHYIDELDDLIDVLIAFKDNLQDKEEKVLVKSSPKIGVTEIEVSG